MYIAWNTYDYTMLIIFYGEYTLSVGKMGDSNKDSVYMFDASIQHSTSIDKGNLNF